MKRFLLVTFLFLFVSYFGTLFVEAHEEELDVDYATSCNHNTSYDRTWYYLYSANQIYLGKKRSIHFPETSDTIKFCIYDGSIVEPGITWRSGYYQTLSIDEAAAIKNYIRSSILSWNDVYYYTYNSNGTRISHKLINVVEVYDDSADVYIYPATPNYIIGDTVGQTTPDLNYSTIIEEDNDSVHVHCTKWRMYFNVPMFYSNSLNENNTSKVESNQLRAGCHELGHVLGLRDLSQSCSSTHNQQLMGYSGDMASNAVANGYANRPTYRDIAGVIITRGIHTDDDHKWIKDGNNVICAICNCTRSNVTFLGPNSNVYEGQTLDEFRHCCHNIDNFSYESIRNMKLIATNGESDYYKCMICNYIEEIKVKQIININNSFTSYNDGFDLYDYIIYSDLNYPVGNDNYRTAYKISISQNLDYGYFIDFTSNYSPQLPNNGLIFDSNNNPVSTSEMTYNNQIIKHAILSPGTYYIKIEYDDLVNIDYSSDNYFYFYKLPHTHNYVTPVWHNYYRHKLYCFCGSYIYEDHELTNNGGVITQFCAICGGQMIPILNLEGELQFDDIEYYGFYFENIDVYLPNYEIIIEENEYN